MKRKVKNQKTKKKNKQESPNRLMAWMAREVKCFQSQYRFMLFILFSDDKSFDDYFL